MSLVPRKQKVSVVSLISSNSVGKVSAPPSSVVEAQISSTLSIPTVADNDLLYKSISLTNYSRVLPKSAILTGNSQCLIDHPDTMIYKTDKLNTTHKNNECDSPNIYTNSSSIMTETTLNTISCKSSKKESIPIKTNAVSSPNNVIDSTTITFTEQGTIHVPRGWNRIREKGLINYISPNKSRITCLEDMLFYLQYEGTCKCGLKCPLQPEKAFSFDPNIASRFSDDDEEYSAERDCAVCKKFEELYPPACKMRNEGRGRKPGKTKTVFTEKKVDEKKKILLTSASPLSMFQTGIDAMKISSSFSVVQPIKPIQEFVTQTFSEGKSALPENPKQSISSGYEINTSNDFLKVERTISSPQTLVNQQSSSNICSNVLSSGVEMPFPSSLMGTRKRVKKQNKGEVVINSSFPLKKKALKKVLPNAAIQRASDLQLKSSLNQVKTQNKSTEVIPSLRAIGSIHNTQALQQLLVSQSLAPESSSLAQKLQHVYNQIGTVEHQSFLVRQDQCESKSLSVSRSLSVQPDIPVSFPSSATSNGNGNSLLTKLSSNLSCHESTIVSSNFVDKNSVMVKLNSEFKNLPLDSTKQPVNKPLPTSSSSPPLNTLVTQGNQQMYLVHLVSQNSKPVDSSQTDTTLVRAFHSSSPHQSYVSTQGQFFLMNSQSNSQSLQSQSITTSVINDAIANTSVANRTLQIQGLLQPSQMQFTSSQIAMPHTLPVHYVTTVNGQNLSYAGAISYPVMQYLPKTQTSPVSYLYPTFKSGNIRSMGSSSNYVRIAPATQSITVPTNNSIEKEKVTEQEITNVTNEEFFEKLQFKPSVSVPTSILSAASTFVSNILRESSIEKKSPTNSSIKSNPSSETSMPLCSGYTMQSIVQQNSSAITPVCHNGEAHASIKISFQSNSLGSASNNLLLKQASMQSEKSLFQMQMNERSHEAASLGKPVSSNIKVPIFSHGEIINKHIVHRVGDIVWTHLPDYPKWPGKVISAHSINKGNPEDNKMLYVNWFGTNQIHLVHHSRLTSFKDGLDAIIEEFNIDQNNLRKRNNKKHLNDFERAVSEALDELQKTKVDVIL